MLEPDQHPQEAHEAFAEDVAAAMFAARAHPDGVRVVTHLLVTVEESDASLERFSHWQDVRVELPQLFALPTGLAATNRNSGENLRHLGETGWQNRSLSDRVKAVAPRYWRPFAGTR